MTYFSGERPRRGDVVQLIGGDNLHEPDTYPPFVFGDLAFVVSPKSDEGRGFITLFDGAESFPEWGDKPRFYQLVSRGKL